MKFIMHTWHRRSRQIGGGWVNTYLRGIYHEFILWLCFFESVTN